MHYNFNIQSIKHFYTYPIDRFLRGTCKDEKCPFSHTVDRNKVIFWGLLTLLHVYVWSYELWTCRTRNIFGGKICCCFIIFDIEKRTFKTETKWNPITSDEGAFCRQSKKKLVTQGGSFTLNFKYFIERVSLSVPLSCTARLMNMPLQHRDDSDFLAFLIIRNSARTQPTAFFNYCIVDFFVHYRSQSAHTFSVEIAPKKIALIVMWKWTRMLKFVRNSWMDIVRKEKKFIDSLFQQTFASNEWGEGESH